MNVNRVAIQTYLKKIEQMYKLSQSLQLELQKYMQPGGQCRASAEECRQRSKNIRNYAAWLKSNGKRLKNQLIKLGELVPSFADKCE